MAKVLVTGALGYVGSHVTLALAEAGHHVVGMDNVSTGHMINARDHKILLCDYSDAKTWFSDVSGADVVVHCAALTSAPDSMRYPGLYYRENVGKMVLLLELMQAYEIRNIVFSSSAAVYSPWSTPPFTEVSPLAPMNPYGSTKQMGEQLIRGFGFNHVILRYFNVAGADTLKRCGPIGEKGTLFSNLLKAGFEGAEFTMHKAADFTPDGFPLRDFIHPTDLALAHVAAVEALVGETCRETLNVGASEAYSVRDVVDAFRTYFPTLNATIAPPRPGDPSLSIARTESIRKVLGWEASDQSSLAHMVATAVTWHKYSTARIHGGKK